MGMNGHFPFLSEVLEITTEMVSVRGDIPVLANADTNAERSLQREGVTHLATD